MTRFRRVLAAAVTLGAALTIAWLSQLPTTYARGDDALVRLSWRIDGQRIDECRPRTAAELEALAPHMRTPEVCTRGNLDYELRVSLDGAEITRDTVRPGGARRDRPIYVYRDIPVSPGTHSLDVLFAPVFPTGSSARPQAVELRFQGEVDVEAREVVLITADASASSLVRVGS